MATTGARLGPGYEPNTIETESTGQQCVRLGAAGQWIEFTAAGGANALVVRYSLPDSGQGGGIDSAMDLLVNGTRVRTLELTSRYAWLYGRYPFTNRPSDGKPRNFFDEARAKGLAIAAGDRIRLRWTGAGAAWCAVDLIDLENAPAPLPAPRRALSILDFGADPSGRSDATGALRTCIEAARAEGRPVWVPAGDYRITGEILVPSNVAIQGAGPWHTTFVGDPALYGDPARRVRFKLNGSRIRLADFAIIGRLAYRNDSEPNDGVIGARCADTTISNLWIEHTKVGIWIYNGVDLRIEGCRLRDTVADGINLCVGTRGTVIEDCAARGTGDDCFAIWPAASDQGFSSEGPKSGHNVIRHCTGQLPFLANGAAVYGGASNRVEDCLFTDIGTGCGILVSTTFPTSDGPGGVDNNFSGTTEIRDCDLVRCGGYDHDWAWRGSIQICMDRRSIAGLTLSGVRVKDSISSGITVVAPGAARGEGVLSDARLEKVSVARPGLNGSPHHDLWISAGASGAIDLSGCSMPDVRNDADHFALIGK
jgi:hypothetical protein